MHKPPILRIRARTTTIAVLAATMLLIASMASAVTVDPPVNDFVLEEGETWTETITVEIPADTAASEVDVYFLADTTGSMGSPIAAVRSGASTIIDGLIAELPGTDLRFGVGDFKDFPFDRYAFRHAQGLTDDVAAVTSAINGWGASGGNDGPEGQFYAFDQIARDRAPSNDGSPAGTIGWRSDAAKILVVFADAPGHDPVCSAITGSVNGHEVGDDITEASVTSQLASAGITFIGISTLTGYADGMDANPGGAGDYDGACGTDTSGAAGQATRIAAATGGVHQLGIDNESIVNVITSSVVTAARSILSLTLAADGEIVPFVTGIDPADGYGPIDTSDASTSTFEVDWEGAVAAGAEDKVFTGALNVVADGRVIASKPVRITVPGTDGLYPPEPEVLGEVLYPPEPEVPDEATPATPVAAQPAYTG
jgi:hypothetical protein